MRTAMEIAIQNIDQCLNALDTKDMLINLLEKEKEQIIQARIDGDENYSLIGGKRYEYAEQYYNETYNQNKS
jgi:hypothetical protein